MPRKPLAVVSSNATIAAPVLSDKSAGKKRKATDEPHEEIPIDDERCQVVDISCDRVRTKINNFINSGEMKVGVGSLWNDAQYNS